MKNKHPSSEECFALLKEYETPEHVIRHCVAVATVSLLIGEALNKKGFSFDLDLIRSAGLIHDIARVKKKHWKIGGKFALKRGYKQEAEIISKHMNHYIQSVPEKLTELDIVCLGDRLVLEDEYVGVEIRARYTLDKVKGKKKYERLIHEEIRALNALIRNIESILGMSVDELMNRPATARI